MERLYKALPPFAPDYSGVCSVLFELGGVSIILDASGCTGNYTGYDEPRWYGSPGRVLCSGLREMDAVMGDEAKLFHKIQEHLAANEPSFIALLGSPAPMVIGMDYTALAAELSQRFSIPAIAFDTSGMHYYDWGASRALLEIAKRFVAPPPRRIPNGINIIGATPLDMGDPGNVESLQTALESEGYRVLSCWAMNSDLQAISGAAAAGVNLVVSGAGLEAARYLERVYGIPFLAGLPVGQWPGRRFFERLAALRDGVTPEMKPLPANPGGPRALIIGEQVTANAFRDCLRDDFGFGRVDVASFFTLDAGLAAEGDRFLRAEDDLTAVAAAGRYDLIVGDPLYQSLTESSGAIYLGLPHYAVSSKVYRLVRYLGEEGTALVARSWPGFQAESGTGT